MLTIYLTLLTMKSLVLQVPRFRIQVQVRRVPPLIHDLRYILLFAQLPFLAEYPPTQPLSLILFSSYPLSNVDFDNLHIE